MLAAAPGSSRCSGSGSFPASARGCRPPALVDRVSRCFVVFLEVPRRVAPPATPSTRGSPRNNQQTRLRTPAARRAHVHLRAERRRELVRRRREVEPLGARDERPPRARAGPQEVEVRGDAPPRRRVHDLDGDAVAPAAAVCDVFLEDLRRCCCRLSVARVVRLYRARRRRDPKNKTPPRTAECTRATQPVPTGAASTSSTSRQSGPSDAEGALRVAPRVRRRPVLQWAKRSQNARGKRSSRDEAHCASLTAAAPPRAAPEAVAPPAVLVEAAEGGLRAVFVHFSAPRCRPRRRRNFVDFADFNAIEQRLLREQRRGDGVETPRHRADAATETTS